MSTPVDELKALGWTNQQIIEAARQEIDREVTAHDPLAFQKAVQHVWERARAELPTYAQLEARVEELEKVCRRVLGVLEQDAPWEANLRAALQAALEKPVEACE